MMSGNPFALDFEKPAPTTGREALSLCSELFPVDDLEWKIQVADSYNKPPRWVQVICYVSARAIMARLDEVFGLDWEPVWEETQKGIRCTITARIPGTDRYVSRSDVAEWQSGDNGYKATHSAALKRAAVHFGVGRYLYALEATFVNKVVAAKEARSLRFPVVLRGGKGSDKYAAGFNPMQVLPQWAIPEQVRRLPEREQTQIPEEARSAATTDARDEVPVEAARASQRSLWWRTGGGKRACTQLSNAGLNYEDVAAWTESKGAGRPSSWDEPQVMGLVSVLITPNHQKRQDFDAWMKNRA